LEATQEALPIWSVVGKTELAQKLGITKQAVYKWVRAGKIPAERIPAIKLAYPQLTLADIRPDLADA
jgi:DNA-binding transcriptional regulator YdaS (Cro superfamily)